MAGPVSLVAERFGVASFGSVNGALALAAALAGALVRPALLQEVT